MQTLITQSKTMLYQDPTAALTISFVDRSVVLAIDTMSTMNTSVWQAVGGICTIQKVGSPMGSGTAIQCQLPPIQGGLLFVHVCWTVPVDSGQALIAPLSTVMGRGQLSISR